MLTRGPTVGAEFRALADNLPAAMFLLDPFDAAAPMRILFANASATKVYGYANEELVGRSIVQLLDTPESMERVRQNAAAIMSGTPQTFDAEQRHRDGHVLTIEVQAALIPWAGGQAVLGIATDVTERRALEQAGRRASRLEAVGHLAGGLAHEFRNLLTVMSGFAELVHDGLEPEDPRRASLTEIFKAGKRAAALTQQLLALSRRQLLQPRVLDLGPTVRGLEPLLRQALRADVELAIETPAAPARVRADATQLVQVVLDLVLRAQDSLPRGGRIAVEVREVAVAVSPRREQPAAPAGHHVVLSVADSGDELSEETLAHVFEPFASSEEIGQGAGLGLSTAYAIVKQSGGELTVESTPGQGTTFRVYLPRVAEEPAAPSPVASPAHAPGAAETVLVVDDEPAVGAFVRALLEKGGYRVLSACSATAALEVSDRHEGPIDLLVTDVVMPGRNGPELYETLRARRPDLAVLFMSGHAPGPVIASGALDAGTNFIEKPFPPGALALAVRNAFAAKAARRLAR